MIVNRNISAIDSRGRDIITGAPVETPGIETIKKELKTIIEKLDEVDRRMTSLEDRVTVLEP